MNLRHPIDVLYSFSIKNIFDNKMDLRLFYFEVYRACSRPFLVQCNSPTVKKFFRFFVYFFHNFCPYFSLSLVFFSFCVAFKPFSCYRIRPGISFELHYKLNLCNANLYQAKVTCL